MLTATDEKIWVLDKDTYSVSWPAENNFWLLEKKDLEIARNVIGDLMARINVENDDDGDSDFGYVFLLTDMSLVIADMLSEGAAFTIRIVDKPFIVQLPHTSIKVRCKDTDQSKIESSLFYFFARLLVQWSSEATVNNETPDMRFYNNYQSRIEKLLNEYKLV